MATIAEACRAYLLADATIAGLVGDRIYPSMRPQDSALPAIVYEEMDEPFSDLDGDAVAGEIQLDLVVIAASKASADAVRDAIRARCASAIGVTASGRTLNLMYERAASGLSPSVSGGEVGTYQSTVTLTASHATGD